MSFDSANINSLFMRMISPESSTDSFLNLKSDDMSSGTSVFAAKLSRLIQSNDDQASFRLPGNGITERSVLDQLSDLLKNGKMSSGSRIDLNNFLDTLEKNNGVSLLGQLKAFLLSVSNQDLKNLTINAKGLSALEALLTDAGFDPEQVNALMANLHEMLQENELTLFECFDQLSGLIEQDGMSNEGIPGDNESENDNLLALSAIPFIETLLTALKLSPEKIKTILSEATDPKKGVDLDILIDKLQQIQKTAFLSNQSIKTTDSESGFQMLLTQLGLENSHTNSSELTLNELIQAFEGLRRKIKQHHTAALSKGSVAGTDTVMVMPVDKNDQGALTASLNTGQKEQILNQLIQNIETKASKDISIKDNQDPLKTTVKADALIHHMESELKQKNTETSLFGKADDPSSYKTLVNKIQALSKGQDTGDTVLGKELAAKDHDSLSAKTGKIQKTSPDIVQISGAEIKASDSGLDVKEAAGRPAVRNLSDYVAHQVKQSLVRAINQGTNELKIQLKPPELGRLMITIENAGNHMRVNIMAENQTTRDILLSNINELKTVFSNSGLNLENFEVDLGSNFRQSMADARNPAGQFGNHHPGRKPGTGVNDEGDLQTKENTTHASSIFNGRLHYVA